MTNFDRIKEMRIEDFVDELFLNIPDESNTQFVFGSWRNKDDVKSWLNSEAEGSNKFVFTESMMKDCIQKIENATRNIPIRKIEFVTCCKNCRYYYATNNVCHRLITVFRMEPEDFCSYGEVKE